MDQSLILCGLLGTALCLGVAGCLMQPLDILVAGTVHERRTEGRLVVVLQPVSASLTYLPGRPATLRIACARFGYEFPLSAARTLPAPPDPHETRGDSLPPSLLPWIRVLPALAGWIRSCIRNLVLTDGFVRMRLGFPDPSLTGMIYGMVHAVSAVLLPGGIEVMMEPCFYETRGDVEARFRLRLRYPAILLVRAFLLIRDPAVRSLVKGLYTGRSPPPRKGVESNGGFAG